MNDFPSKTIVEAIRAAYPADTRVELVSMKDPYSRLRPGAKGRVQFVDDIGTIFCRWDNGEGLGVVYGEDTIRKITEEDTNDN
mgnify:CR=1 FL=1